MSHELQLTLFRVLGYLAQLIGALSTGLFALTIWQLYKSVKTERPVISKRLLRSMLFSLGSVVVLILTTPLKPTLAQVLIWGGVGLMIGAYWSRTVTLFRREQGVFSKNTFRYILIWAATFTIAQLFATIRHRYVNGAALFTVFSAGIMLGLNGMLWQALRRIASQVARDRGN